MLPRLPGGIHLDPDVRQVQAGEFVCVQVWRRPPAGTSLRVPPFGIALCGRRDHLASVALGSLCRVMTCCSPLQEALYGRPVIVADREMVESVSQWRNLLPPFCGGLP